jgi:hypothetical protein
LYFIWKVIRTPASSTGVVRQNPEGNFLGVELGGLNLEKDKMGGKY